MGKYQPQESSRENSTFFLRFKSVEPERLELETERPEMEAEERALPPAASCAFSHLNRSLVQHLTQAPQKVIFDGRLIFSLGKPETQETLYRSPLTPKSTRGQGYT